MKAFNILAVSVFVGAVGFITYSLIKDSQIKYYTVTHAENSTIEDKMELAGFVYPSKEIEIKPQLSGVVDEIFVSVGEEVREGDPIASISLVPNSSEVENLTSSVNVAKINLTTAQANYDRQKMLLSKKAIPQSEYETAERDYLTAKENYNSAVNQLSLRQKGKKTGNNIVRSSTSGTIIDIPVKVGSSVVERSSYNAGTTIATVSSSDHFVFKADVPERSIKDIYANEVIKLSLLAYDTLSIDAVITTISAKGNIVNGAVKFPIEAEFSLTDQNIELRSGYSATAEILISRVEDVLSLPEKCINFKGDTTFVYVTDSLRKHTGEKIVELGISDGDNVEIRKGITKKDLVITNYHD